MRVRIRPRLTYANVVASIALFVALGGGAWAHHRNSVGPQQIQRDAVKARHVERGAIGAAELRSAAVRRRHIRNASVTPAKLSSAYLRRLVVRRSQDVILTPGQNTTVDASCAPGEQAVGGSRRVVGGSLLNFGTFGEEPIPSAEGSVPTGWRYSARNLGDVASNIAVRTFVICARP